MKYVVNFRERSGSSYGDCEAMQERVLALFQAWQMPPTLKVEQFLIRVGEFGGYVVLETDTPADIHYFATVFAVFACKVEPVLEIGESIGAEMKAIQFRKGQAGA